MNNVIYTTEFNSKKKQYTRTISSIKALQEYLKHCDNWRQYTMNREKEKILLGYSLLIQIQQFKHYG